MCFHAAVCQCDFCDGPQLHAPGMEGWVCGCVLGGRVWVCVREGRRGGGGIDYRCKWV